MTRDDGILHDITYGKILIIIGCPEVISEAIYDGNVLDYGNFFGFHDTITIVTNRLSGYWNMKSSRNSDLLILYVWPRIIFQEDN